MVLFLSFINFQTCAFLLNKMTFHIITLFPESFGSYLNESILARAQKSKKISVKFYNPRDFVKPSKTQSKKDKPYLRIDNKPFGGGPGMVLEALPIIKAIEAALKRCTKYDVRSTKKNLNSYLASHISIIWLNPSGKQFDNKIAEKYKKIKDLIIICGRYEGIDARVKKMIKDSKLDLIEISIGPYVLTGGELPAMVILDTVARRIPGVLGKIESVEENRISSSEVYTRPEVLEYKGKKYRVPKVLLSGNHKKIEEWRKKRDKK